MSIIPTQSDTTSPSVTPSAEGKSWSRKNWGGITFIALIALAFIAVGIATGTGRFDLDSSTKLALTITFSAIGGNLTLGLLAKIFFKERNLTAAQDEQETQPNGRPKIELEMSATLVSPFGIFHQDRRII